MLHRAELMASNLERHAASRAKRRERRDASTR